MEKVTRVLSPEEQELLDKDWVGRNGAKRKMEVRYKSEPPGAAADGSRLCR